MKLVMAISADWFIAQSESDDMRWTGPSDKAAFKVLTGVGHEPLAVSWKTKQCMPDTLPGRDLYVLSTQRGRGDGDLVDYHSAYPDGWLIGGQTLAMVAKARGLLDEVHICQSSRRLKGGIPFNTALIEGLTIRLTTNLGVGLDNVVTVRVYR